MNGQTVPASTYRRVLFSVPRVPRFTSTLNILNWVYRTKNKFPSIFLCEAKMSEPGGSKKKAISVGKKLEVINQYKNNEYALNVIDPHRVGI